MKSKSKEIFIVLGKLNDIKGSPVILELSKCKGGWHTHCSNEIYNIYLSIFIPESLIKG